MNHQSNFHKSSLHSAKMFEARIVQGSQLKKIIEAIRELVVDANLDCNEAGITMQVRYVKSIDNSFSPEVGKELTELVVTGHATAIISDKVGAISRFDEENTYRS